MYPAANPYQAAWDIYYPLRVVLFIGLLSIGYILSRQEPADTGGKNFPQMDPGEINSSGVLPWQRIASRKAVERYSDAQDRKWRRWNEAMFERKS
jgi:hypothetical protein